MGDLLSLTAGFLWAATSLYLKRVVRTSMTPSQMLFYQLGFSAVQLSVMSLLFEPRQVTHLTPVVVASIAYQGIIVAFASYLVWFWLIQVYPVSNISGFHLLHADLRHSARRFAPSRTADGEAAGRRRVGDVRNGPGQLAGALTAKPLERRFEWPRSRRNPVRTSTRCRQA